VSAYLTWPDYRELAEDYARGVSLRKLAEAYPKHPYKQIRALLQHLGVWRTTSQAAQVRNAREKAKRQAAFSHIDPWGLDELDFIVPPSPNQRKFVPMLTVNVATGEVTLDRMSEALRAKDRFEVRRGEV
jgi:hypothetical protein